MLIDQKLFLIIHDLTGKSRLLDFLGIFFSEYLGYFLLVAAGILVFSLPSWKKRYYYFAQIALGIILSRGIITELIRFIYHRPRPFQVLDFEPLIEKVNQGAFPSGHAAFYFTLAFSIILINKKWGRYFIVVASLIGFGRVFVGVHWPLDIIGGVGTALLSSYFVNFLLKSQKPSID